MVEQPNIGWFEGREHHYPVRVYYEDTDFSGVVYYANYLKFCERARSSFFRLVGFKHAALWEGENPIAFAIRKIELEYKKPARIDDNLIIRTTYDRIKGPRLFVSQAVWRGEEELVTAVSEATAISPEGRPRRMPKHMVEGLGPYLEET